MTQNCLMQAEKEFWTHFQENFKGPIVRGRKRISISISHSKLRTGDFKRKIANLISKHISQEEGIILPIVIEDNEGEWILPTNQRLKIIPGDRIRISESVLTLWKSDNHQVEHSLLKKPDFIRSCLEPSLQEKKGFNCDNYIYMSQGGIYRDTLKQIFHKKSVNHKYVYTVDLIKELLSELIPGDEVELEKAVEIIKRELTQTIATYGGIMDVKDRFIENFLKLIGTKMVGFTFVRLKNSIRCVKNIASELGTIDQLFQDWEENPKTKI